ncbi:MAG: SprT family protein [Vagococcus sp.]
MTKPIKIDDKALQQLVERVSRSDFGKPFLHHAFFNKRLKTTGGRYHLSTHDLDFNPKVLEIHGLEELIKVIKHELCHYHLHLEGKGYQHRDSDFKELLKQTGGSRYVKRLTDESSENYHQYTCQKCGTVISRRRRLNITKYGCRCGGSLRQLTNKQ